MTLASFLDFTADVSLWPFLPLALALVVAIVAFRKSPPPGQYALAIT